jgi:hypothetical protein
VLDAELFVVHIHHLCITHVDVSMHAQMLSLFSSSTQAAAHVPAFASRHAELRAVAPGLCNYAVLERV